MLPDLKAIYPPSPEVQALSFVQIGSWAWAMHSPADLSRLCPGALAGALWRWQTPCCRGRGHPAGRRSRPPVAGDLLMSLPPGCELLQKLDLTRGFNRRAFGSANTVYRQFRAVPL